MHGRRFRLIGWIALAVGGLLAGCSQLPANLYNGPTLGILSRGQISFSSLSFNAINPLPYTQAAPTVIITAKGLGGNVAWSSDLEAGWDLVYACVNNGTNQPNGTFNYVFNNDVLAYHQITSGEISKNGKATVTVNTPTYPNPDPTGDPIPYYQHVFDKLVASGDITNAVCPNTQNYTVEARGYRWNDITINLQETDSSGTTTKDHITWSCSDPANPSADTCTIQ